MTWQSLLAPTTDARAVLAPWVGRSDVWDGRRRWVVTERPGTWGWYTFSVKNAKLVSPEPSEPPWPSNYFCDERGVLALLVGDTAWRYSPPYVQVRVPLPPVDAPRFCRVRLHVHKDGCGYVLEQLFDSPAEEAVRRALLEEKDELAVAGATPAHRAAFDALTWRRKDIARRRVEAVAARAQADLYRQEGTAEGRRRVAAAEPERGARLALEAGGGRLAGFRMLGASQAVVDWTLDGQPFQCVVTVPALAILDAGVCLAGADRVLTLEALPAVCREARETHRLVVLRHVGEDADQDEWSNE